MKTHKLEHKLVVALPSHKRQWLHVPQSTERERERISFETNTKHNLHPDYMNEPVRLLHQLWTDKFLRACPTDGRIPQLSSFPPVRRSWPWHFSNTQTVGIFPISLRKSQWNVHENDGYDVKFWRNVLHFVTQEHFLH